MPTVSFAQTPTCTIIYGGGEVDCETTGGATKPTATPTRSASSGQAPTNESDKTTTKGGLPVYDPTNATTTPDTGPEMLGLATLIPAAAAGFYLRKKTK